MIFIFILIDIYNVQSLHAQHTHAMIYIPYSRMFVPVPVATPSEACVCSRSLAGDCEFDSRRWAWISVFCECCQSFLLRADHSSRGILPLLVYVVAKLRRWATMTQNRVKAPQGREISRVFLHCIGCYWGKCNFKITV
jgi:hypothetical protein